MIAAFSDTLGTAILRHRSEVAVNAAKVEAELASKTKSDFIANMSHELRTPLNAILGFAEVLQTADINPIDTDKITEYSDIIHMSAKQLLALINDILEIGELQNGTAALDARDKNLNDIVQACYRAAVDQAAGNKVELCCTLDDAAIAVKADTGKIEQAITNILSNAIKFSNEGGQVNILTELAGERLVVIKIIDTGIGMTADEAEQAVMPFGQTDTGRDRKYDGTGLGLPIAKAIVELHGGSLQIESQKDNGTEVAIYLPARILQNEKPAKSHENRPKIKVTPVATASNA